MARRNTPRHHKQRATLDGQTGWLYVNSTRLDGLTGFNWSFSTNNTPPYLCVTVDDPFTTVEAALADARDYGVGLIGEPVAIRKAAS